MRVGTPRRALRARDGDASLSVLTEHLVMGTTEERRVPGTIPFDGREALHDPMSRSSTGFRCDTTFVMKKDGCVYDLVYVTTPDPSRPAIPPSNVS